MIPRRGGGDPAWITFSIHTGRFAWGWAVAQCGENGQKGAIPRTDSFNINELRESYFSLSGGERRPRIMVLGIGGGDGRNNNPPGTPSITASG